MIVLGIDTCGATGSVALGRLENGTISLLAQAVLAGRTYSAQLVPVLRDLLLGQNLPIDAIKALVVVNGPGSFTGVRIGVSAAKGLAEALNIPVLAVSRLAVLASKAGTECAAFDAGRREFYFRDGSCELLLPVADAPGFVTDRLAVCEPSAAQAFPHAVLVDPPAAEDALRFAAPRLLAREFAEAATLDGNYVRRSNAEIFTKTAGKPS